MNKTPQEQLEAVLVENQQLKNKLSRALMDIEDRDAEIVQLREQLRTAEATTR